MLLVAFCENDDGFDYFSFTTVDGELLDVSFTGNRILYFTQRMPYFPTDFSAKPCDIRIESGLIQRSHSDSSDEDERYFDQPISKKTQGIVTRSKWLEHHRFFGPISETVSHRDIIRSPETCDPWLLALHNADGFTSILASRTSQYYDARGCLIEQLY